MEKLLEKADQHAMDLQKAKDECDKVLDGGAPEVTPIHTPTARKSASPEREGSPAEKSTVRQLSHEFDRVAGEREEQNQSIPPMLLHCGI